MPKMFKRQITAAQTALSGKVMQKKQLILLPFNREDLRQ